MNIAVVTSAQSWFIPYSEKLVTILTGLGYEAKSYQHHKEVADYVDTVLLLSYFNIVEKTFIDTHKNVVVVHESDLPRGKGWAPFFWQVLEGKNSIPILLIEASESIDSGRILLRNTIELDGHELYNELREKQALATIEICIKYCREKEWIIPVEQHGEGSFYRKRTPKDSELNIDKSIREQFDLLRTVDNANFPAFFYMNGVKYHLQIEKNHD